MPYPLHRNGFSVPNLRTMSDRDSMDALLD